MKELFEKTEQLISAFKDPVSIDQFLSNKDKISELSDHCKKYQLYTDEYQTILEFKNKFIDDENKIINLFNHLCFKISNAPTNYHLVSVIILTIPILEDFITEYENKNKS